MNVTEVDMNAEKKISFQLPIVAEKSSFYQNPRKYIGKIPRMRLFGGFPLSTSFLDSYADADHDRTAPQIVSHPQYRKITKTEKNPDFKKSIIVNLVLFLWVPKYRISMFSGVFRCFSRFGSTVNRHRWFLPLAGCGCFEDIMGNLGESTENKNCIPKTVCSLQYRSWPKARHHQFCQVKCELLRHSFKT